VPQEIVNSVSDLEKRRQEAINEVIYTERDFVRDMEYLRDVSLFCFPLASCTAIVLSSLPGDIISTWSLHAPGSPFNSHTHAEILIYIYFQSWINPLKDSDIIPVERRSDFLMQVFWNMPDIIAVNTRLRDALSKRQKQYAVVDRIGDIFLDIVPHFGPFVHYGAHQLYGKYEFEKEKSSNPAFTQFVDVSAIFYESGNP
jgi:hypothetical protein